jgi:hypothetical protein
MKQPWPSPNKTEIKEPTHPKLAQTLNNRTRSKSIKELSNKDKGDRN